MNIPLQITSRNFDLTDAIQNAIRERADKLERICDRIIRCDVVVEIPHQRQQKGVLYNVKISISVPGSEIVVKKEPHEDLYAAINRAFESAARQIQKFISRQRQDVKHHEEGPFAVISQIFPDEGYGFLTAGDGREIYFHQNSVVGCSFAQLAAGERVRFVESLGEKGPQASTVKPA